MTAERCVICGFGWGAPCHYVGHGKNEHPFQPAAPASEPGLYPPDRCPHGAPKWACNDASEPEEIVLHRATHRSEPGQWLVCSHRYYDPERDGPYEHATFRRIK